jgi:hypothetical protein
MANENNTNTSVDKPKTYQERILEAVIKGFEKKASETAVAKVESGQDVDNVIVDLMKNLKMGSSPEELSSGINKLATTPFDVPGSRVGGGQAIMDFLAGKGFNPEAPRTQAMGEEEALKRVKLLGEVLQHQTALEKAPVEMDKATIDVAKGLNELLKETPEGVYIEAKNKAQAARMVKEEESKRLTEENVKRAQSKLQLTYKKWGQVVNKTKELTKGIVEGGLEPGRLSGLVTSFFSATGQNPYVKGFNGQLIETSIDLAKIAAPSSRPGPEFARMMAETLPKTWYNLEEAKGTVVTSMTNSFANYAATHPEEFPEGFDMDVYEWELTEMFNTLENMQKKDMGTGKEKTSTPGEKVLGDNVVKTSNGVLFKYRAKE